MNRDAAELQRLAASAELVAARLEALAITCRDVNDAVTVFGATLNTLREQIADERTRP